MVKHFKAPLPLQTKSSPSHGKEMSSSTPPPWRRFKHCYLNTQRVLHELLAKCEGVNS